MAVLLAFTAVLVLVPAAALILGGLHLYRRNTQVHRVPVEAVVVHFENFRQPARVTFDYPAPDGSWLRDRKVAGLVSMRRQGHLVQPGDRMTVWVDPRSPRDVSLGQVGSASGFVGVAMMVVGGMWVLGGTGFAVSLAGYVV